MSTRSDTRDRWRRIIQQQRASRLPVVAFCRRAGVPQSSFFAWRKRLRAEVAFAEVKLAGEGNSPVVTPVTGGHSAAEPIAETGGIELRLPGRRCVVVRPGFDRQTLLELLHTLEANSSELATREAGV